MVFFPFAFCENSPPPTPLAFFPRKQRYKNVHHLQSTHSHTDAYKGTRIPNDHSYSVFYCNIRTFSSTLLPSGNQTVNSITGFLPMHNNSHVIEFPNPRVHLILNLAS